MTKKSPRKTSPSTPAASQGASTKGATTKAADAKSSAAKAAATPAGKAPAATTRKAGAKPAAAADAQVAPQLTAKAPQPATTAPSGATKAGPPKAGTPKPAGAIAARDVPANDERPAARTKSRARVAPKKAREPMRHAKYAVGQVVKHRFYPFRGVIFDIDPVFNNTEEWWTSIPEEIRPVKDQPFYHLLAENAETEYVAYVSEQNLLPDDTHEPLRHPKIGELFTEDENGRYQPIFLQAH